MSKESCNIADTKEVISYLLRRGFTPKTIVELLNKQYEDLFELSITDDSIGIYVIQDRDFITLWEEKIWNSQ